MLPLRQIGYDDSRTVPNIVVDGAPNEATVLCVSHWPGVDQPPGLGRDLSAEMAFVDRYETWVQYCSRPTLPRVDMRPLAAELTALERRAVAWRAGAPGELPPHLDHDGESTITEPDLVDAVITHLGRHGVVPGTTP